MQLILYKGDVVAGDKNLPVIQPGALSSLRQLDGYKCPACNAEAKGLSGYEGTIAHFMWRCTNPSCGLSYRSRDSNLKPCIWETPLRKFEDEAYRTLCSAFLDYKEKKLISDGK